MSAMAGSNNFAGTLNGLFKETYADKLQNLIPDGVKLYKMISFMSKDKQPGNLYHQPVILGHEHGVTFAASDDDAFALNAPVAGQIKDAQVRGNPVVLRSVLGYVSASRAVQGGNKAFMDATKFLVANMLRSITKKLEIEMLYGQMGYGTVGSVAGTTLTIAAAEWASGIWAGAENMPIDIYDATGVTLRVSTTVSSVSLTNKQIVVADATGVVATDVIFHKGANGNEFAGIHKIITNTGTLFNISAASYSLWKGNTYGAGSASLSLAKVERALALAVAKGLDGDVTVLVSPATWNDLLVEQTALRKIDSTYSSAQVEAGHKAIKFYGQSGTISIEPTIYCKEGYAYVLAMDEFSRVGSTDVTFKRPAMEGEFFRELESNAGYELRCYTDQALFCSAPGKNVLISGIVNSA
jgi:hypothetical protein